jgi:hypothetical protein
VNPGQGSRKHPCTSIPSPQESFGPSHTLPNGAAGPVFPPRYGMPRARSGSKGSRRHLVSKIMNECEQRSGERKVQLRAILFTFRIISLHVVGNGITVAFNFVFALRG